MSDFRTSDHPSKLLVKIRELRADSWLCDLIFIVSGKEFPVHKVVVAAASQYFRSLIQYDVSPSNTDDATAAVEAKTKVELKLPDLSCNTFELVLGYIYSGEIQLCEDNVEDVLLAADVFVIEDLKSLCWTYLGDHITPTNCLGIRALAHRLGSSDIGHLATKCLENNFLEVCQGDEFLQQSADIVYEILGLDDLNLGHDLHSLQNISENAVLKVILCWVNHDKQNRKKNLKKLLKTVRWAQIKRAGDEYRTILDTSEWKAIIEQAFEQNIKKKKHPKHSRGQMEVMVVCGAGQWHNNVFFIPINPVTGVRMCMTDMTSARQGHSVIATGGYMYVIGGEGERGHVTMCERYDIRANKWSTMASMQRGRSECKVAAINNKIYVLGGYGLYGFGEDNEVYDIATDTWGPFPYIEMVAMRARHYCKALKDKLYYLAETSNPCSDPDFHADAEHTLENPFRLVQCYDPATKEWSAKSPEYGKTEPLLGKAEDCIFVMNEKNQFVYDTKINTWEKLPVPQSAGIELSLEGMPRGYDNIIRSSDSFFMLHQTGILKTSDPHLGEWELVTPAGLPSDFPAVCMDKTVILPIPTQMFVTSVALKKE